MLSISKIRNPKRSRKKDMNTSFSTLMQFLHKLWEAKMYSWTTPESLPYSAIPKDIYPTLSLKLENRFASMTIEENPSVLHDYEHRADGGVPEVSLFVLNVICSSRKRLFCIHFFDGRGIIIHNFVRLLLHS